MPTRFSSARSCEMATDLSEIQEQLRTFVQERDWSQYHDPKNLAMLLASEVGELVAELRWVRSEEADAVLENVKARERVVEEVGDIGIALLLFCERTGIDLIGSIKAKVGINGERYPAETSRGRPERPA